MKHTIHTIAAIAVLMLMGTSMMHAQTSNRSGLVLPKRGEHVTTESGGWNPVVTTGARRGRSATSASVNAPTEVSVWGDPHISKKGCLRRKVRS